MYLKLLVVNQFRFGGTLIVEFIRLGIREAEPNAKHSRIPM